MKDNQKILSIDPFFIWLSFPYRPIRILSIIPAYIYLGSERYGSCHATRQYLHACVHYDHTEIHKPCWFTEKRATEKKKLNNCILNQYWCGSIAKMMISDKVTVGSGRFCAERKQSVTSWRQTQLIKIQYFIYICIFV